MKKINMVMFRFDVYGCDNPQQFWKDVSPIKCKNSIWIPQTMGSQIWMWFEFENTNDKNVYLIEITSSGISCYNSLFKRKEYAKNMFMHDETYWTQSVIDHWTKKENVIE